MSPQQVKKTSESCWKQQKTSEIVRRQK